MPSEPDQGPGPQSASELGRLKAWLENPQRLLRLVSSTAAAHAGPLYRESVEARLREEDLVGFVRLLAQLTLASRQVKSEAQAAELATFFRQRLQGLPADLVVGIERALAQMPGTGPSELPMPVQLASRLALRLGLEAYQRGELSASSVNALLGRMSGELATLRRAQGMPAAADPGDVLEEDFWSSLSEPDRRHVLIGQDAWCVPPRAVRRYLEELTGQPEAIRTILERYADCVHHATAAARSRAALALNELADLYASCGNPLLEAAIGHAGRQLVQESRSDVQSLLATAFAHLSRQAAGRRGFRALEQALELLDKIESVRAPAGEGLRARISVESHLREFIREAVVALAVPRDLVELLRRTPGPAAALLSEAFEGRPRRIERDRVVEMTAGLGPAGLNYLREKLRTAPPATAVATVGLLSRLEPAALVELLPGRLARWNRAEHDTVVRLLAAGGAPGRGQLLLRLLEHLDPLVLPAALDEIGMSGDPETAPRLMRLAGGTLPQSSEPYLRVKAVEALGRLREASVAPLLRRLVEARGVWRWTEPREIRIAAAQALIKIDPEWARECLKRAGLSDAELAMAPLEPEPASPWVRQRRYLRIPLAVKVPTLARTLRGQWRLATQVLSLGGGLAESENSLAPGTELEVELEAGLRTVRATAVVRDPRPPRLGFEIVQMDLDDRSKLRRLLVPYWQEMARAAHAPA